MGKCENGWKNMNIKEFCVVNQPSNQLSSQPASGSMFIR